MKNLPRKALALLAVAALALMGLVALAIVRGTYEALFVGLIAFIGTLLAARGNTAGLQRSVDRLTSGPAGLKRIAAGVARLEHTVTASPRMLEGSTERQVAETAARFDWLARRHEAEAERLDTFMRDLEATVTRNHEDLVTQLHALRAGADAAPSDAGDSDPGATGRGL